MVNLNDDYEPETEITDADVKQTSQLISLIVFLLALACVIVACLFIGVRCAA